MRLHLFRSAQKGLRAPRCAPRTRGITTTTSGGPLEPVRLSYATYENATSTVETNPFLVMHGLFGSKSNWNSLCKAYQKRSEPQRKVIAIDARNHGESPHDDNHTYAHLAADVRELYEGLGIRQAAVMGHSMGGMVMMLFALKYPELVERLIVADISPVKTSPSLDSTPEIFRAMEAVNLPTKIPLSQARADVDRQLSRAIPNKGLRAFLLTNLIGTDDGSYNWRLNMSVLLSNFNGLARFPLTNDLHYHGPVLFVGGSNSDYLL